MLLLIQDNEPGLPLHRLTISLGKVYRFVSLEVIKYVNITEIEKLIWKMYAISLMMNVTRMSIEMVQKLDFGMLSKLLNID